MYPIIFNTNYLNLIKTGQKTQTIRKNSEHYSKIKKGDLGYATNYRTKVKIKIIKAYIKNVSKMSNLEAKLDGFKNKQELLTVIKKKYGKVDFEAKFIRFSLV
jgi:hypothetical protein